MKKAGMVLAILLVATAGLFAQEGFFSIGGGGFFASDFGGGFEGTHSSSNFGEISMTMPYSGGGAFLFADARYGELSAGIFFGGGKRTVVSDQNSGGKIDASYVNFFIGVFGKYPFAINNKLSLFPLLGIDYSKVLSLDLVGVAYPTVGNGASDYSALWFKLGGGADYALTNNLFLRGEVLYGIRLPSETETTFKNWEELGGGNIDIRLGHGLTAKIGLGYTF